MRESALKARADFESETHRREREIQKIEQRILTKEEQLARKLAWLAPGRRAPVRSALEALVSSPLAPLAPR